MQKVILLLNAVSRYRHNVDLKNKGIVADVSKSVVSRYRTLVHTLLVSSSRVSNHTFCFRQSCVTGRLLRNERVRWFRTFLIMQIFAAAIVSRTYLRCSETPMTSYTDEKITNFVYIRPSSPR